jgi:uncharacterized membrane protein
MHYPLHDLVLLFFIYGFLGWCAEVCYAALRSGGFVNRGFLNGPICPIYGVGMVIVILCLTPIQGSLLGLFLGSMVLTTVLEFLTGLALEKLFHLKWWDYSSRPLNLRGYVCLEFSILWGIGGTVIMKLIHPPIYKLVALLPTWVAWTIGGVLLAVLAADLAATLAQIRQLQKRLERIEALAGNIHSLSDALAERLYDGVQVALEKSQPLQQELEERQAALEEKKAELAEAAEERQLAREAKRARLEALLADRKLQLAEGAEERRMQVQRLKEELEAQLKTALESPRLHERRLLRAFPGMRTPRTPQALEQLREALRKRRKK